MNGNPLPEGNPMVGLFKGVTITARDLEVTLTEAVPAGGSPGWYSGKGRVTVPFLAGASFEVTFERIYVNHNREVTRGEIFFVTQPVEEWIGQELQRQADNKQMKARQAQQQANQEKYADVAFEEDIVLYDKIAIAAVQVDPDGTVRITDSQGKTYVAREKEIPKGLEKALVIEDKNGDQWVLQPGKAPEKVPGGGLPPVDASGVSNAVADVVKKALDQLKAEALLRETEVATQYASIKELVTEVDLSTDEPGSVPEKYNSFEGQPATQAYVNQDAIQAAAEQVMRVTVDYYYNKLVINFAEIYKTVPRRKELALLIREDNTTLAARLQKAAAERKSRDEQVEIAKSAIRSGLTKAIAEYRDNLFRN